MKVVTTRQAPPVGRNRVQTHSTRIYCKPPTWHGVTTWVFQSTLPLAAGFGMKGIHINRLIAIKIKVNGDQICSKTGFFSRLCPRIPRNCKESTRLQEPQELHRPQQLRCSSGHARFPHQHLKAEHRCGDGYALEKAPGGGNSFMQATYTVIPGKSEMRQIWRGLASATKLISRRKGTG